MALPELQTNVYQLNVGMPPSRGLLYTWDLAVKNELATMMQDFKLPWKIWLMVFLEKDGKQETKYQFLEPGLVCSNSISTSVEKSLQDFWDGFNPKFRVRYGWFAAPCENADMDAMTPDIIELFTSRGAFNKEAAALNCYQRKLKEADQ